MSKAQVSQPENNPAVAYTAHELSHVMFNPVALEELQMPRPQRRKADPPKARDRELIKLRELQKLVPVDAATLWRWLKAEKFPQPVRPTGSIRFWYKDEVLAWRARNEPQGPRSRPWNRK
jgi:predicted DNA-binding transcriptional regulator AlpA